MASPKETLLGKLALEKRFLTKEDLEACIRYQEEEAPETPLGEILIETGYLEREQVDSLLEQQKKFFEEKDTATGVRRGDKLFGKLVVGKKLATAEQVNKALRTQEKLRTQGRKSTLGEVLVAQKVLSAAQVKEVLESQKVQVLTCPKCGKNHNVLSYDPSRRYSCRKCMEDLVLASASRVMDVESPPSASAAPGEESELELPTVSASATRVRPRTIATARLGETVSLGPEEDAPIEIVPPEEEEDELTGTTLGGYAIEKRLGHGSMGTIYKALQVSLGRMVALKVLKDALAENELFLSRFQVEARSAGRLNHPNIVAIYDVGQDAGRHYFSMEYVEGENVGSILDRRKGRLPILRAIDICLSMTEALVEAHASGIVHRDIKPDNILLSVKGVAKLADLGIAKTTEDPAGRALALTDHGVAMGTPYYIAPEQAKDSGNVDGRADIYSLGASLYHMLTGRVPYYGTSAASIFMKLATEDPPDPLKFNPLLPFALLRILTRMMAKDPARRYASAEELREALQKVSGELHQKKTKKGDSLALGKRVVTIQPVETDTSGLGFKDEDEAPRPREEVGPPTSPSPARGESPSRRTSRRDRPTARTLRMEVPTRPSSGLEVAPGEAPSSEYLPTSAATSTSRRPKAKKKVPVLYIAMGIVLLAGAGIGASAILGGSDKPKKQESDRGSRKERREKNESDAADGTSNAVSGAISDSDPAGEAEKRLESILESIPEDATALEIREKKAELGEFLATLSERDKLSSSVQDQIARLEIRADDADLAACQSRLSQEAGLRGDRPDYRRAARILEEVLTPDSSERLRKEIEKRLASLREDSSKSRNDSLRELQGLASKIEKTQTGAELKASVEATFERMEDLALRLLEEDGEALVARRSEVLARWSEISEKLEREEAALRRTKHVRALLLYQDALLSPDFDLARAKIDEAYAQEEFAPLQAQREAAHQQAEEIRRIHDLLLERTARLVGAQEAFTFERVSSGGSSTRIEVTAYGQLKPDSGGTLYCKTPSSVFCLHQLTVDSIGRLLEGGIELERPADRAAVGLYLAAFSKERHAEATRLVLEAAEAESSLASRDRPLLFGLDYLPVEEAVTRTEEKGISASERKARWEVVRQRLDVLASRHAESEFYAAASERLAKIAERASKGR